MNPKINLIHAFLFALFKLTIMKRNKEAHTNQDNFRVKDGRMIY